MHSNRSMKWIAISNAIIQSTGLICISVATYTTKSAWCLCAILLVMNMGMSYTTKKDDERTDN